MRFGLLVLTAIVVIPAGRPVQAQEARREAAVRYYQHWAQDGTLVGDMQGYGASVWFPVRDGWAIGGGWDRLYYDMETPVHVTGVAAADPERVDGFVNVHRFRVDARRRFRPGRRWEPYLEAGVGVFVANADSPAGRTPAGGVYRLAIDTPTTPALNLSAGGNLRIAGPVLLNVALSYGRAFRGYRVTDEVTGSSGAVRPLSPLGPSLGVVVRF